MQKFTCDQCGACCNGGLIIEADLLDAMREPRLLQIEGGYHTTLDTLRLPGRAINLAIGAKGCPFAGIADDKCSCAIYPTRPNVCVGFEAGSEQCQEVRLRKGRPVLCDVDGNPPSEETTDAWMAESDWPANTAAIVEAVRAGVRP